jgi:hypothetical protein
MHNLSNGGAVDNEAPLQKSDIEKFLLNKGTIKSKIFKHELSQKIFFYSLRASPKFRATYLSFLRLH